MDRETATRARIAALIYTMTNAVIFGGGLIVVMTVPALAADAAIWIPLVVVTSFILAAPAAWFIAPWMRARFGQQRRARSASAGAVRPL
jgi:membrane protein implicated in regulation of membrane protease activity